MCLFPTIIKNKKYLPNKKNEGNVPIAKDRRVLATPIGCGFCIECKNKEAKKWQVRLLEDVRENTNGKFVTLTFSNESIKKIVKEINKEGVEVKGYELDNRIATHAIRHFCEKWRSRDRKGNKKGKSVRHWFVTELGHKGTENIHIHGIIWTNKEAREIRECWDWGYSWIGKKNNDKYESYVNEKTVNYIIKYVKKMDFDHKYFKPKIMTSSGIGNGYLKRHDAKTNKYKKGNTDESYTTRNGGKIALPIYYRNKIYSEEEREKLWIEKLDKMERYVLGEKVSVKDNHEEYYRLLKEAREKNRRLGYMDGSNKWNQKEYEEKRREMLTSKRIANARNGLPPCGQVGAQDKAFSEITGKVGAEPMSNTSKEQWDYTSSEDWS